MDLDREFTTGWKVEKYRYYANDLHRMIGVADAPGRVSLSNIGCNGENLTIAVLSMNRADVTIRLMDSIAKYIPNFAGEFLIGDNGSSEDQKQILLDQMERMPYACRLLDFGRNYGVSGGRNRTFREVKTDWLLSSDNDMYFIGNPLPKIQRDIQTLGCHFLNVPILNKEKQDAFLYGGHLYVDNLNAHVSVGGGSVLISPHVEANIEHEPFLCTFLAGGASVMNRNTFFACGGYDENMFVGFEDTEFSVRLFQMGMKIGTLGVASMIHDHPKPQKLTDAEYENKRFSAKRLEESARYFEQKHGFKVWNPAVVKWLDSRREELLSGTGVATEKNAEKDKPRIALVIDGPDWALDHVAGQVIRNLSGDFEFKRIYLSNVDNLAKILLLASDCQLIHFLWRPLASDFYSAHSDPEISALGMSREDFYRQFVQNKVISVAVYDHLLLDGSDAGISQKLFTDENTIVSSYTVSSEKLMKLYNERNDIRLKPSAITQDGVDLSLFKPENLERFENVQGRTIRIGWVGNSKWQVRDLKGINTVIKPAIDQLIGEGYDVELVTSDRNERMIPHEKMPGYYNQIDLYVCASLCEGTPNPVLEAMACGVPVISTDVGLIPEAFGPKQMQYVLRERSAKCLADAIRRLMEHPEDFAALSEENLKQIQKWDWPLMTQNFKRYFDRCLAQKEEP